ncbi:MAG: hypothetical protein LGB58_00005 [Sulfurovum sp.]|nr:hypothetical protein [Sulfurovum sp.]
MPIIDNHAPLRKTRVKHPKLPPWLTKDVIEAMATRDRLKKGNKFEDYKKQRNRVKSLVRSAKKSYFDKLIESDRSTATIWKAINEITNKSRQKPKISPTDSSPDSLNLHLLTLAEKLARSNGCHMTSDFVCNTLFERFL